MKLTTKELYEAKEALEKFSRDPLWEAFLKFELDILSAMTRRPIALNEPNYGIMQAHKEGAIAAFEILHRERADLLKYKGDNNANARSGATVLPFRK